MKQLITEYVDSKKHAWSPNTTKSEISRLLSLFRDFNEQDRDRFLNGKSKAETFWEFLLKSQAPYSRQTTWSRLVDFYDWLIEADHAEAPNPYKRWKKENARAFKYVYRAKTPSITFKEAAERIQTIKNVGIRNKAKLLLYSGLRYAECDSISGSEVTGKGNKVRDVFLPTISGEVFSGSYWAFWNALRQIELTPHLLRKLFATQLVKTGLNNFDLCTVMGWNDLRTARFYVAPQKKAELKGLIDRMRRNQAWE